MNIFEYIAIVAIALVVLLRKPLPNVRDIEELFSLPSPVPGQINRRFLLFALIAFAVIAAICIYIMS